MSILRMSLSAGVLVLVIGAVRAVALHKLPKTAFLLMWGIALARLLVPFSIPLRLGGAAGGTLGGLPVPGRDSAFSALAQGAAKAAGTAAAVPERGFGMAPLTVVFFAGMLAVFCFFAAAYVRSERELRFALPVRGHAPLEKWLAEHRGLRPIAILQSDRIAGPVSTGLARPRIILPTSMDLDDGQLLQYVLAHEYCHIRRLDTLWKLLLAAALCIHWFNPLVWVMFVLANRDLELACDERVVRRFGAEKKAAYAYSILGMAERRSPFAPFSNGFSKNVLEERIVSIMKTEKITRFGVIAAMALVIATATVFAAPVGAASGGRTPGEGSLSQSASAPGESDELPPYTFATDRGEVNYPEYFTYDKTIDRYFYNGKRVAVFFDDNVWNGKPYSELSYDSDHTGDVVYIKTVRDPQTNKVVGMAEMTEKEAEEFNSDFPHMYDYLYE